MAVRIRLKRLGAKKAPFYRIVVADSRTSRNGKSIDEIGIYDPTKEPVVLKVDAEAANKWLANGAQPSDTVKALLKKAGVIAELFRVSGGLDYERTFGSYCKKTCRTSRAGSCDRNKQRTRFGSGTEGCS